MIPPGWRHLDSEFLQRRHARSRSPPIISVMESPLQQLLRAVEGRCDPSEFADLREDVNAVAEAAKREAYGVTGLFADVLAILLQPQVQVCLVVCRHRPPHRLPIRVFIGTCMHDS